MKKKGKKPRKGAEKEGEGERGKEREKKARKQLALPLLVVGGGSPRKTLRGSSFGEPELDALMRKTMNLGAGSSGTSNSNSGEQVLSPPVLGPGVAVAAAAAAAEAEQKLWREPRRWSVEEAAEMMGVTVKDVARAFGLNFDLQRVMTRGHTIFGFFDDEAIPSPAAGSSLERMGEGGRDSPLVGAGGKEEGGRERGALSEDMARLNRSLMEAFSTEKPSKELLQEVEGGFRIKEVRLRFLAILSQPRSKRMMERHLRFGGGGGGRGGRGHLRVHLSGFEALMQLASG
eukprot:evm.model.NODE_15362_length_1064_cov_10.412594.1